MTYKDFKDLRRRTVADKVLCNKGFILLNIWNMMDINLDLLQCFIIFFDQKVSDGAIKKNHTKWRISERITQTNDYKVWKNEKYIHLL